MPARVRCSTRLPEGCPTLTPQSSLLPSILPSLTSPLHFFLRARFRLRTAARRFISTLRSSGVIFAHEALPAALVIFLRFDFEMPFQRLRPAARNLARGITITSSMLTKLCKFHFGLFSP